MIQDLKAHWTRLTCMWLELRRIIAIEWDQVGPITQDEVENHIELLLDVRDIVNQLHDELMFLKGHIDGMTIQLIPAEKPNARGDTVLEITPGTAPTCEIADSLGVSIAQINGARKRLGIKPAGWVQWRLANGIEPEPSGTYNCAQWRQFRDDLHPSATVSPPDRLIDDDDL